MNLYGKAVKRYKEEANIVTLNKIREEIKKQVRKKIVTKYK